MIRTIGTELFCVPLRIGSTRFHTYRRRMSFATERQVERKADDHTCEILPVLMFTEWTRSPHSTSNLGCQWESWRWRHETSSIFYTSPASEVIYAVFPMNSSDVGRSRCSITTVKPPSSSTFTREPVFGNAGSPASGPPHTPWESAYNSWRGPVSTSTRSRAPAASSVGLAT